MCDVGTSSGRDVSQDIELLAELAEREGHLKELLGSTGRNDEDRYELQTELLTIEEERDSIIKVMNQ